MLRDTGCNNAAVKKDLISESQLSGRNSSCVLMDGTLRRFPMATVLIDTPYYTGEVEAMCMPNPIHDLIIGNISIVKPATNPEWQPRPAPVEGSAVATRVMHAKVKQSIKPLIVPPVKAEEINCEELKKQQKSDRSLSRLWKHAEEKRVFACKNQRTYQYTVRKEIHYRIYSRRQAGTVMENRQIVVPATLRKKRDGTGTRVDSWWSFRLQEIS